ncbi:PhoH family protein [Saccharicrinis sp. FJH54]|uniref:PhoH family protein n=1 Tax=Saccharicrinis sp. FJH54 TaxID=3344665 RepID=UPI0035D5064F
MPKVKKSFVLDTNVILHDFECIYQFQENDIYLPIHVLEELDRFKKGNDQINFNAREFTRELDKIAGDELFTKGVSLGRGKGRLFVVSGKPFPESMKESFFEMTPDHRIIAIADWIKNNNPKQPTIFVSKDINLRLKAKSIGIMAQDYRTDKVKDPDVIHKQIKIHEGYDSDLIAKLYKEHEGMPLEDFSFEEPVTPNDCFILKNHSSSVLARYDAFSGHIKKVMKEKCFGIEARNAEQAFSLDVLMNQDIKLVALTGRAGTGKTLLALAAALAQHQSYNQILLARPIVPLANRDLGFLPGDEKQKIMPYMQPLFDNLNVIKHQFTPASKEVKEIEILSEEERLMITPLAYIRGRSLSDTYFIIDEAQNLTPHEVKTIITRAGEGTKMVFTGDIQQIDSPYLDEHSNGLAYLADRMKGQDLFAHINLVKGERSYLSELASMLL